MAAPTSTVDNNPSGYTNIVSGTNISAGNNDYVLSYQSQGLAHGFSIVAGTLTAVTVTVLGFNNSDITKAVDITSDLFGVASLSSNIGYACNVEINYQNLVVRAARSNATNAIYLEIYAPRR